ncbi:MAG: hypothetical protein WC969_00460 [Elusimicrobiota bacterium]|jgi:hypothetical protein
MRTTAFSAFLLLALSCPGLGQTVRGVQRKACKPWLLAATLSSGRLRVSQAVEHACTPENDGLWRVKYGFEDASGRWEYAYDAATETEAAQVKRLALEGLSQKQADLVVGELSTAVKSWKEDPGAEKEAAVRELFRRLLSD